MTNEIIGFIIRIPQCEITFRIKEGLEIKSICAVKKNSETDIDIVEKQLKEMNTNEHKVKVLYGGVCGTDMKLIEGKYPIDDNKLPLTIGHEFVGRIEQVSNDSEAFQVGDYIVGKPTLKSCMECENCKSGYINLCKDRERLGINVDGAFTEYINLSEKSLIKVNFLKDVKNGVWLEPISVVARGINTLKLKPNYSVLVAGAGAIGVLTILMLKDYGVDITVLGLESDCTILEYLKENQFIDGYMIKSSGSENYNAVIDCTGNENAINNLLNLSANRAQVLLLGTNKFNMNI
ncbi:zinc-binding dehydrogenase [Oceanobacillus oncorhynchi]|uniref:zinc-binding dehydrogenase n=1 Tax=Oceanobacillus oncorhynchi TaxID=545501 RepID=UPI0034D42983